MEPVHEPSTAPDAGSAPGSSRRTGRTVVTVVLAVVAFGAALAIGSAVRSTDEAGYDAEARLAFVSACVSAAGDLPDGVCECAWDEVTSTVPYDRYEALAAELVRPVSPTGSTRLGGPTDTIGEASLETFAALPPDLRDPVRTCVERADALDRPPTTQVAGTTGTTARS